MVLPSGEVGKTPTPTGADDLVPDCLSFWGVRLDLGLFPDGTYEEGGEELIVEHSTWWFASLVGLRSLSPAMALKFDREKIAHKKCVLKSIFKVCALWLPRYFRYSIKAKRVESTWMGGDRSLHSMFTCVLTVLQCLKESKEKKIKNEKRRVRWNTKKWEHRR